MDGQQGVQEDEIAEKQIEKLLIGFLAALIEEQAG